MRKRRYTAAKVCEKVAALPLPPAQRAGWGVLWPAPAPFCMSEATGDCRPRSDLP